MYSGHRVTDDFPEVRKIVEAGATNKTIKDYELSRSRRAQFTLSIRGYPGRVCPIATHRRRPRKRDAVEAVAGNKQGTTSFACVFIAYAVQGGITSVRLRAITHRSVRDVL